MNAADEVGGHRGHQRHLAVAAGAEHHHARAELLPQHVGHVAQLVGRRRRHLAGEHLDAAHLTRLLGRSGAAAGDQLPAQLRELALARGEPLVQRPRLVGGALERRAERRRDVGRERLPRPHLLDGAATGERLDAPHAGGDAALAR